MTRTIVESRARTVIIGFDQPFCVIGERINPTGRKKLAAELEAGDFSTVEADALEMPEERMHGVRPVTGAATNGLAGARDRGHGAP